MTLQLDLLSYTPPEIHGDRFGVTFDAKKDRKRLDRQADKVFAFMSDGLWHTLKQISEATGSPEASCSARLRDFRRGEFGARIVDRRRCGEAGLHEYRLGGKA